VELIFFTDHGVVCVEDYNKHVHYLKDLIFKYMGIEVDSHKTFVGLWNCVKSLEDYNKNTVFIEKR